MLDRIVTILLTLGLGLPQAAALAHSGSQADLGFAGPPLHAVIELLPSDPRAPPPSPPTPSCPEGERWDTTLGACTNPCAAFGRRFPYRADLNACYIGQTPEFDFELRPCLLADGTASTQVRERQRDLYNVYFLDGTLGYIGGPWGAWSEWGECRPIYTPSPPPPQDVVSVGQSYWIPALICGPDDAGYHAVAGYDWSKQQIIDHYRGFGISGRCPEAEGYQYWLMDWHSRALTWVQQHGMWHEMGLHTTWPDMASIMNTRAAFHGDLDPPQGDGGMAAAHALCRQAAIARWPGFAGTAQYQTGSGKWCVITGL